MGLGAPRTGIRTGMTLRCGRMAYTNALPLYAAFDAGVVRYPGTLEPGVPSELNRRLLEGDLDLSPMSAFAWAKHSERLVLLPDFCIGARSEVVSVLLASGDAPGLLDGRTIAVTADSASGRNLLRVLLERRYGVRPAYDVTTNPLSRARAGEPALLIGDAALDARDALPPETLYDLGRLWREWTGRHSVFGVWAVRRETFERRYGDVVACLESMSDAYAWSRAHPEETIALARASVSRPAEFYRDYYGKLNYQLHAAARAGLAAYCSELYAIGAIGAVPSVEPEHRNAVAS